MEVLGAVQCTFQGTVTADGEDWARVMEIVEAALLLGALFVVAALDICRDIDPAVADDGHRFFEPLVFVRCPRPPFQSWVKRPCVSVLTLGSCGILGNPARSCECRQ